MYTRNISSNITFNPSNSTYNVYFDGKIIEATVTDKYAIVDQWVHHTNSIYGDGKMVVGLEVEWRPHPISYMSNKSMTLQLCINNKSLIIQLFYINEIPESLKTFVGSPNYTFVGIEVGEDIAKLRDEYGLQCKESADIREEGKRKWPGRFRRLGLKDLANDVAGLHMKKPKHVCMSNWEARVLGESQIECACIDPYASYKIGHKMIIEN